MTDTRKTEPLSQNVPMTQDAALASLERYEYGWADPDLAGANAQRGLTEAVVRGISARKNEPEWMLDRRLKGLKLFGRKPMPNWGADLSGIDFDNIKYYVEAAEKQAESWEDLPEDIKKTYDKLGIPEAERQQLVSGVAAQYECLDGETYVWTANRGQVRIKEIEAGDRVFSFDEEREQFVVAPVKASAQTDTRLTYVVRTANGKQIRATDNHPVLALRDERKPGRQRARWARRWTTVGELREGDFIAVPRRLPEFGAPFQLPVLEKSAHHLESPIHGPAETNVDLMWLLGLFIGDGNLHESAKTHRVQFAIPETDREVRAEITRVVAEQFGLETKEPDEFRIVVNSKALVSWFWEIGMHGDSHSKRVPDWVFGLPIDQRLAFLGGWVDADGYVKPESGGSVVLTCVSAPLIEQAAELAELSGLPVGGPWGFQQPHRHDPTRIGGAWRLGINGEFERLGCRNPKRTERFGGRGGFQSAKSARGAGIAGHCTDWLGFVRVTSKDEDTIVPVYDIEVDGPHNFIAEGLVVHNSTVLYHSIREDLEQQGVVFMDTDTGLKERPELFKEYFGSVIPVGDNKFAALNTSVWSGGSFIYVPKGVHVDIPLQAYFRINTENMGQFERTLIIADEGSFVHYIEGCLPAGELIETAEGGFVPIETIKVGDQVLAHDGKPHRVNAVQVRDLNGTLHTFAPMSPANEFSVTDEHPVLIVPRSEVLVKRAPRNGWKPEVDTKALLAAEPKFVPAKDVAEGDFLVYPKPKFHAAAPMVLEFARLAGYYLAEGRATLTNGCKSLVFSFHIDEKEYAEEVLRLCRELWDAKGSVRYGEDKHEASVTVYSNAGYEALTHHIGTGSSAKRLSADILGQHREFLENLLETYVRGDGNVVERGGAQWHRVHTVSRELAFQLQALNAMLDRYATVELRREGGKAEIQGREVTRKDLYQVQWTEGGTGPKQARDAGDYFLVPIKKRSSRETSELVYNLDVEEPDSYLPYGFAVHNCTAPVYSSDSLHSAVVEIIVKKDARVRYTTIQNWSSNVYNLVTKRAIAEQGATMEWVDGNLGAKVTMKYPAVVMVGEHAKGEVLSVAMAGEGQHQDTGAKMTHAAPYTSSTIVSKSISRGGGRTSYRGLVQVDEGSHHAKSTVKCDALLVDTISRSDTYPYVDIREDDVDMGHEATVSKIGEDQMFYLMSRGLTEDEAAAMIVRGFIEPIAKELPMEYALELNRLIELQMEGAVG